MVGRLSASAICASFGKRGDSDTARYRKLVSERVPQRIEPRLDAGPFAAQPLEDAMRVSIAGQVSPEIVDRIWVVLDLFKIPRLESSRT